MIETGYFKGGNEYVVTSTNPPRPLLNYVWNARILSGINNFGGGVGAYGVRAQSYIDAEENPALRLLQVRKNLFLQYGQSSQNY